MPLQWITPAGLHITQLYYKSTIQKLSISIHNRKSRTFVLRSKTDIKDTRKQNQAIIPNIIHSLDASHLINIINSNIENKKLYPIISVHDCFGTLPNQMALLCFNVKKEFIFLYSKEVFLNKFHDRIIQSVLDNHFIIENNHVLLKNKMIEIPKLPNQGNLQLDNIIHSKYIIT